MISLTLLLCAINAQDYPRGDLLVEPAKLAQSLSGQVILDARSQSAYDAGHVPGALNVNAVEWGKLFQDGKDVEGWAQRIGALGIAADTKVVVYDDAASKDAARVWWILKYWGAKDVRLLQGQWAGWQAIDAPISREQPRAQRVAFRANPQPARLSTKTQVLREVSDKHGQIIDARTPGEHIGKTKLAARAGCIPGSTNLDWVNLVDQKTQRFKSAAELQALFAQHGVQLDKPLVAHCQSGGRSSVMSFALELMGAKDVSNYHASWAEWGNAADTPVEKEKK